MRNHAKIRGSTKTRNCNKRWTHDI